MVKLPVPPGQEYDGQVQKIVSIYEILREKWAIFRAEALRNYEYVIGEQIDEAIKRELKSENRPAMVFNLVQNKIVTIAGLLESNTSYMRAIPVNEGDSVLADLHTQLVSDWAMKNCGGVREITKAAIDAAIGRIGWTNNYWTTTNDPSGKWITESYDPFMVMFDPDARKKDQSDWRYLTVSGFYTAEEIIGIYSEDLDEETIQEIKDNDLRIGGVRSRGKNLPTGWVDRLWSGIQDMVDLRQRKVNATSDYTISALNDLVDSRTGRYRVIEFHDRRSVMRHAIYNSRTREQVVIPQKTTQETEEAYSARRASQLSTANLMSGGGFKERTFVTEQLWITAVAPWLLPRAVLLEKEYPVQGKGFQFKPIFCYDFHPDITKTQSLIDVLIDPQDSYNQRRMSFLEWIMNAVNPDWYAPENSITPAMQPDWSSRKRGKIKFYRPIGGLQPEREHPMAEASSLKVFSDEDRDLAETLTGITPNTQGLSENTNESGILFAQKVQRAMTALSFFFGNLHASMREIFNYTDANLQVFMTLPRKIRVWKNPTDPQWMQVNQHTINGVQNDVSEGEYDFAVDTEALGETAKQVKFAEALAFIRTLPPQLVKWDELFKLWDSPVAEPMRQFASAMLQVTVGNQLQQMQAQQQQAQLTAVQQGAATVGSLEQASNASDMEQANLQSIQARAQQLGQGPEGGPSMSGRAVIPQGVA